MADLRDILREKDKGFTIEPSEGSYARLAEKIRQKKRKKMIWLYSAAATIILVIATVFAVSTSTSTDDIVEQDPVQIKTGTNAEENVRFGATETEEKVSDPKSNQVASPNETVSDLDEPIGEKNIAEQDLSESAIGSVPKKFSTGVKSSVQSSNVGTSGKAETEEVLSNNEDNIASETAPVHFSRITHVDPVLDHRVQIAVTENIVEIPDVELKDAETKSKEEINQTNSRKWLASTYYEFGSGYRNLSETQSEFSQKNVGQVSYPGVGQTQQVPHRTGNDMRQSTWAFGISGGLSFNRWNISTGIAVREMGYTTHVREFEFPDPSLRQNKDYEAYANNYSVPEVRTKETEFKNVVRYIEVPLQVKLDVWRTNRLSAGLLTSISYKRINRFNYVVWEPEEFVYYHFRQSGNGLESATVGVSLGVDLSVRLIGSNYLNIQPVFNTDVQSVITDPRYREKLNNYGVRIGFSSYF